MKNPHLLFGGCGCGFLVVYPPVGGWMGGVWILIVEKYG